MMIVMMKTKVILRWLSLSKEAPGEGHHRRALQPDLDSSKLIAIGALRYFMLKFTRNSVIAFDFKDALSFEGETGPYIQYAVVRARNIFRKGFTACRASKTPLPASKSNGVSRK